MKKMMIFAIAALSLTMAACNGKKAEQPQTATTEVAVVTDTAFQNKAAGDYQSYDGSKVITLNSDLTVTTKNTQDYYKWELIAKPEGDQTIILLDRKGVDKDIQTQDRRSRRNDGCQQRDLPQKARSQVIQIKNAPHFTVKSVYSIGISPFKVKRLYSG